MIDSVVVFFQNTLLPLGAIGVFSAAFLEEVIAPIPSTIVLVGSGFILASGALSLDTLFSLVFKVAIPAALGMALGSLFVFGLAYFFGKPAIERWGKWFGLTWEDIEKSKEKFSKGPKDEITLFVLRATPAVPSVAISAFAGLIRFPLRPYLLYSFLGSIVRALILGFVGSRVGALYFHYAEEISDIENYVLVSIAILIVAFVVYRFVKNKKVSV